VQTIGIRELKNRLSEVLRSVKAGEHVLVTDRGTVVPSGLARLVARGIARQGAVNDPSLYENLPRLRRRPRSAARLLDEARGER
jgi:antitoxin (DNA-binding transcriptional repressor) of toxin-antitoxin stability system